MVVRPGVSPPDSNSAGQGELSVSVIIPVLNGATTIGDTLNALTNQVSVTGPVQIIVVDNGSIDQTKAVVRTFSEQGVILLEEPQRGPAAARNRGLRAAAGDIIAHVDADTIPTRRWLSEMIAPFSDPEVILVGGQTLSFPPETPAQRYISACGRNDAEFSLNRDLIPFTSSQNLAVRREQSLAIGGWAEDMPTGEDVDFCFRLREAFPGEFVYQSGALLFHHERRTDDEFRLQAWAWGEGIADVSLRYQHLVKWTVFNWLYLAKKLVTLGITPPILGIAKWFNLASEEQVEFARYHRMYNSWYWRGFLSMYLGGKRRRPGRFRT